MLVLVLGFELVTRLVTEWALVLENTMEHTWEQP